MGLIATNYRFTDNDVIYRGETRDVYSFDRQMVSIATDRLTVFGHLFPEPIPYKGQVLNLITAYFAEATKDIVPNWIESVPDPNVSIGKLCNRFEVNFVIRGSLVGHVWRIYESGMRQICGLTLPDGMKEYDFFDEPIITPSTKAPSGYEEDISASEIISRGIMTESEYERLSIISRQLFIRGKQMARSKNLILADTKYEFGTYDNEIYQIDELHTPDSSRYFDQAEYEAYVAGKRNEEPSHWSKEKVRQYLLNRGYSGLEDQVVPELSQDYIVELSRVYQELYERVTGKTFEPQTPKGIADRIQHVLNA